MMSLVPYICPTGSRCAFADCSAAKDKDKNSMSKQNELCFEPRSTVSISHLCSLTTMTRQNKSLTQRNGFLYDDQTLHQYMSVFLLLIIEHIQENKFAIKPLTELRVS